MNNFPIPNFDYFEFLKNHVNHAFETLPNHLNQNLTTAYDKVWRENNGPISFVILAVILVVWRLGVQIVWKLTDLIFSALVNTLVLIVVLYFFNSYYYNIKI